MEKLEKQVNEAEAERFLEKALTKRNILGLIGAIGLAYIFITTRLQHPYVRQGPSPHDFVVPVPPPAAKPPEKPAPIIKDDPEKIPPPPGTSSSSQANTATPKEDPLQSAIADRIKREHESAFASMLVPEDKALTPETKQEKPEASATPLPTETTTQPEKPKPAQYIISAHTNASLALDSRIDGEHTGPIDAHFVQDLMLKGTRVLVVPKGSKVIGETVAVGGMNQRRIAAAFTVIQRDPVNRACDIDLVSPALSADGSSGLTGKVDTHLGSAIAGTTLAAVLQGVSMGLYRGGGYGPSQVIIGQTANGASQATGRLLDLFIKLPTITVSEGGLADFPFVKDTPVSLCGGVA